MNENIFSLNVSSLRQYWWYLEITNYVKPYISRNKSFNIDVSIWLSTLAHILNVYHISLNITNYPIFNMQSFSNGLLSSSWNCFDQVVSPQWNGVCSHITFQMKTSVFSRCYCCYKIWLRMVKLQDYLFQRRPIIHKRMITMISYSYTSYSPVNCSLHNFTRPASW